MIIKVLRIDGLPPPQPMAFDFKERGGCLGRGAQCELVLPDTHRYVSRVHAQIDYQGPHRCVLTVLGQNPMSVAGVPLLTGQRCVLTGGEQITIGHLDLLVVSTDADDDNSPSPSPTAVAEDPFAVFSAPPVPVQHKSPPVTSTAPAAWASVWDNLGLQSTSIDHLLADTPPAAWRSDSASALPESSLTVPGGQEQQLLAAFQRGLGLSLVPAQGLHLEWMERAGRLLRQSLLAENPTMAHQVRGATSVNDSSNS